MELCALHSISEYFCGHCFCAITQLDTTITIYSTYVSNNNTDLNSLPIDELGEVAYESRWWCQVKCERRAGHAGIHGDSESGNHHQVPSHRETRWRYLPTSILTMASQERGKGRGKLPHKCTIWSSKLHNLPERVCII